MLGQEELYKILEEVLEQEVLLEAVLHAIKRTAALERDQEHHLR